MEQSERLTRQFVFPQHPEFFPLVCGKKAEDSFCRFFFPLFLRLFRLFIDFIREIDKEKFIGRQTYLSDGERKENDEAVSVPGTHCLPPH